MEQFNNDDEIRLHVTDWETELPARLNKGHAKISRKVVTKGVIDMRHTGLAGWVHGIMTYIDIQLRKGYEVRIPDFRGKEAIRLYPCVKNDMKTVFVAAQTMGPFREILSKKRVRAFVKGKEATKESAQLIAKEARRNDKRKPSVTPDLMVSCPNCGTSFRIGKQLV